MTDWFTLAAAFLGGGLGGQLSLFVFAAFIMAWDLKQRIKEDIPLRRKVWIQLRYTPRHIWKETDWVAVAKLCPRVTVIGALCGPVGYIFMVGFKEVFF